MHFVSDFLLPSLSTVLERLWTDIVSGDILVGLGLTMARTFAGFSLAAVAGVIIGVTISLLRFVRWSKDPGLFVSLIENGAALVGIAFAAVGVFCSTSLHWVWADGAASIAIGLLLVAVAIFLLIETLAEATADVIDCRQS